MKKTRTLIACVLLFLSPTAAFPAEQWETFLTGRSIQDIAVSGDTLWCTSRVNKVGDRPEYRTQARHDREHIRGVPAVRRHPRG